MSPNNETKLLPSELALVQKKWQKLAIMSREELKNYSVKYASDPNFYYVANFLANYSFVDKEIWKIWFKKGDKNLRRIVCWYTDDEEILDACSYEENEEIRAAIASNPKAPIPILCFLARDPSETVRAFVASNPQTPEYYLRFLANDVSLIVLEALSKNPHTSCTILKSILRVTEVKEYAKKAKFYNYSKEDLRLMKLLNRIENNVIKNPRLDFETMKKYAKSRKKEKRIMVASNHRLPKELFEKLSKDKSIDVVKTIARNHSAPVEVLTFIFQKYINRIDILTSLVQNSKTPKDILVEIFNYSVSRLKNETDMEIEEYFEGVWMMYRILGHKNIKQKTCYTLNNYLKGLNLIKKEYYYIISKIKNRYFYDIYLECVEKDRRASFFLLKNRVAMNNISIVDAMLKKYESLFGFDICLEIEMVNYSKSTLEYIRDHTQIEENKKFACFWLKNKYGLE